MPYKDLTKQTAIQREKFHLWREIRDGFADEEVCKNCGLSIFAFDEGRHTVIESRWYHFVDPIALGIRPFGKVDPVYDLTRQCETALRHRFVPEAYETWEGTYEGHDPRSGAYVDMKELTEERIERLPFPKCVAEP